MKNRFHIASRRSGGILVAVKHNFKKYCREVTTDSKVCLWFILDKCALHSDKDILFGAVYIPPVTSKYTDITMFDDIEAEMVMLNQNNEMYISLMGDFNSRTYILDDFALLYYDLLHEVNLDAAIADILADEQTLDDLGIPTKRQTLDIHVPDTYGRHLLELCKTCSLYILNGRVGHDRYIGSYTTTNNSVIDYVIASPVLLSKINEFDVLNFDPMFSDVHCGIELSFKNFCLKPDAAHDNNTRDIEGDTHAVKNNNIKNKYIWNPAKQNLFIANIDRSALEAIVLNLDNNTENLDVNVVVNDINTVWINSAQKSLRKHRVDAPANANCSKPKKRDNTWYSVDCDRARIIYLDNKTAYRRNKSYINLTNLKRASKSYKKAISIAKLKSRREYENKLRNMKKCNSREYWKLLNSTKCKSKKDTPITMSDMYEHFKGLNQPPNIKTDNPLINVPNTLLDQPFTNYEITQTAKKLKCNKTGGDDNVINEYIKCTIDIFLPIYNKLFNHILDTGNIPSNWTTGDIIPIYKNKGDKHIPGNYRGITILNSFSKLFTCLVNERLTKYVETNSLLLENQAGFRKGYSTTDHIFLS